MNLPFSSLLSKMRKSGRTHEVFQVNPVVRHWELLCAFGVFLLVIVGVLSFFLYTHFLLENGSNTPTEETRELLDEKKLRAVVEKFEKKREGATRGGVEFIDPSIPF